MKSIQHRVFSVPYQPPLPILRDVTQCDWLLPGTRIRQATHTQKLLMFFYMYSYIKRYMYNHVQLSTTVVHIGYVHSCDAHAPRNKNPPRHSGEGGKEKADFTDGQQKFSLYNRCNITLPQKIAAMNLNLTKRD